MSNNADEQGKGSAMDGTGAAPLVEAEGQVDPLSSPVLGTGPVLYTKLTDDDVLLGRGKRSYNHEGNVRFRKFVLELADSYSKNDNKAHRKALAQQVVNRVARNGGKFLRQVEDERGKASGMFEGVPPPIVRTKVKQALRDMAAGMDAAKKARGTNMSGNQASGPNNVDLASPGQIFPHYTLANAASFLAPSFSTGGAQPGNEYSRLLQIAALQQRIQEREQAAMFMTALEQQRSMQMAQLVELHRTAGIDGAGLTPEQQELLRGLGAGPLVNATAPSALMGNPLSLHSVLLQPPSNVNHSLHGNNMFAGNIHHHQPFASLPSVSAQLGGQLNAFPNLVSGLGQGNILQNQVAASLATDAAQNIAASEPGLPSFTLDHPQASLNAVTAPPPASHVDGAIQGFGMTMTPGTDNDSPSQNGVQKIEESSEESSKSEATKGIDSVSQDATSC